MASIRKINNHYHIDYYDEAGKRHRVALGIKASKENYKLAMLELKKIEYELSAGIYLEKQKRDKANKYLKEGFDEFIKSRKDVSEETIKDYEFAFKKILDYCGDVAIKKITPDDIEKIKEMLIAKDLSKNSIASYFKKIKVVFKYFVTQEWITKNPVPEMQMRIEEPKIIPRKDLEEILAYYETKEDRTHYRILSLLLLTGMRISELLRLSFDDIDFRENIIIIKNSKGKRNDKFPLYDELRSFLLKEFPKRKGLLFNYKSRHSLKFLYKYLVKEGYDKYNFHSFRKTFISKLVNSGLSVFDVMTLARHRSIKTTLLHYTSAEINRMGKEINEKVNLGTIMGTKNKKGLKQVI